MLGGTISVVSQPAKGSVFTVTLPAEAPAPAPASEPAAAYRAGTKAKKAQAGKRARKA